MPIDPTAGDVAADMERIFKPLAGRALVTAFHHDRDVGRPRGRARGGWRRVTLAAPAAVLLVTAALAIGYGRVDRPAARTAKPTAAVPLPPTAPSSAAGASGPTPSIAAPVASTPAPAAAVPAASVDVAAVTPRPTIDPRPAADPASAAPRPSESTPAPAPQPRPVAAARPSPPPPSTRPVAANVAAGRRERADPAPATLRCTPDSLEDRCIYQDVLNADTKLRLAYDDAKRGGVSKLFLSAVARRWNRARKDADYSPDETIRRYERLAEALDEERRDIAR